jgi:acylphosphatase
MEQRRVRIVVRGIVQGVGFRASTQRTARDLGLTGWVRNLPDDSVLLEAQGPAARVAELEAWCKVGPPSAEVTGTEVTEQPVVGGEREFGLRF